MCVCVCVCVCGERERGGGKGRGREREGRGREWRAIKVETETAPKTDRHRQIDTQKRRQTEHTCIHLPLNYTSSAKIHEKRQGATFSDGGPLPPPPPSHPFPRPPPSLTKQREATAGVETDELNGPSTGMKWSARRPIHRSVTPVVWKSSSPDWQPHFLNRPLFSL